MILTTEGLGHPHSPPVAVRTTVPRYGVLAAANYVKSAYQLSQLYLYRRIAGFYVFTLRVSRCGAAFKLRSLDRGGCVAGGCRLQRRQPMVNTDHILAGTSKFDDPVLCFWASQRRGCT